MCFGEMPCCWKSALLSTRDKAYQKCDGGAALQSDSTVGNNKSLTIRGRVLLWIIGRVVIVDKEAVHKHTAQNAPGWCTGC